MIKNDAIVLLLGVAAAGCQAPAEVPSGYQGIVELDRRVLGFEVPGRLTAVHVAPGSEVHAGDALAVLDSELERTAHAARDHDRQAAEANVDLLRAGSRPQEIGALASRIEGVRANEALIKRNLESERDLLQKGFATRATIDEFETRLQATVAEKNALLQQLQALRAGARPQEIAIAEARAQAAEETVKLGDARLTRYELKSPVAGYILDTHALTGEVVAPGTPVVSLGDPLHPYADVFVPQGELDGIRVGSRATVRVDASADSFPGRVEHIAERTEFTPRFLFSERERPNLVVRVRVRVDNLERKLHAGVPAFVTVERGGLETGSSRAVRSRVSPPSGGEVDREASQAVASSGTASSAGSSLAPKGRELATPNHPTQHAP